MAYSISRGTSNKPLRACIYGPEGVGKTTFASKWPNAVFIDVEDGSGHYDVARLPRPKTWGELLDEVIWCANSNEVGTVVLDTADAAEALCIKAVLDEHKAKGIEQVGGGYGKGYTYLAEEFRKLIECLDACVTGGKNVLAVAHAQIKKFEQPDEHGAYDRWELKLQKKCSPLLKEWCDLLLFANFKTDMEKDKNGNYHATGGKRRVMYASHTAAYDAKNRLGLPDEMPFEFSAIEDKVPALATGDIVKEPVIAKPEPEPEQAAVKVSDGAGDNVVNDVKFEDVTPPEIRQLHEFMKRDGITQEQVQRAIGEGKNNPYSTDTTIGEYDIGFVREVLVAHWTQIAEGIKAQAEYEAPVPFD